jgi:hypothetical protein
LEKFANDAVGFGEGALEEGNTERSWCEMSMRRRVRVLSAEPAMPAPTMTTSYEESWTVFEGIWSLINEGEGPKERKDKDTVPGICLSRTHNTKKMVSFFIFSFFVP